MISSDGKYLIVSPGQNYWFFADLEMNGPITGNISLTPIFTDTEDIYKVNKIKSIWFQIFFSFPLSLSSFLHLD